ncbi:MAG: hypothetical protein R2752_07055 [Vicinamibacterales bacterium]
MKPALLVVAAASLGLVPSFLPGDARVQSPTGQVFRASADLVTIDVSVRAGSDIVGGLTASDFVLLDNGVPQRVEVVAQEAVPLEVSILLETTEDVPDDLPGRTAEANEIAALARPADLVRLVGISTTVRDLIPLRPRSAMTPFGPFEPTGIPAAHDALAAALMRPVGLDRRHLIIAITNGIDAMSTLDAARVLEVARRSEATLVVAAIDLAFSPGGIYTGGRERLQGHRQGTLRVATPTRSTWRPFDEERFDVLREACQATGGDFYLPGIFDARTATAVFEKAFADYRRSYLLRYTPTGVAREGWHEVSVTVPRYPSYRVQARRGYAVESGGASASGTSGAAAGGVPPEGTPGAVNRSAATSGAAAAGRTAGRLATLDDIADAYDRGDYGGVATRLASGGDLPDLARALVASPTRWPANPHREAAFVLELADAAVRFGGASGLAAARDLLTTYRPLVRHPLGPDAFERYWLWGAVALAEGTRQPTFAGPTLDYARSRVPDEPRFALARTSYRDQRLSLGLNAQEGRGLSASSLRSVEGLLAEYDDATRVEAVAQEARVRKAWLLHRVGRDEEALSELDGAGRGGGSTDDDTVGFWRALFRGRVLDALDRTAEAAEAYRAALAITPTAQSARAGLMAALLRSGDRAGAEALADAIETAPVSGIDPWWLYAMGEGRMFPEILRRLREQTR